MFAHVLKVPRRGGGGGEANDEEEDEDGNDNDREQMSQPLVQSEGLHCSPKLSAMSALLQSVWLRQ